MRHIGQGWFPKRIKNLVCQAQGTGFFLFCTACQQQADGITKRHAQLIFPCPTGNPAPLGVTCLQFHQRLPFTKHGLHQKLFPIEDGLQTSLEANSDRRKKTVLGAQAFTLSKVQTCTKIGSVDTLKIPLSFAKNAWKVKVKMFSNNWKNGEHQTTWISSLDRKICQINYYTLAKNDE